MRTKFLSIASRVVVCGLISLMAIHCAGKASPHASLAPKNSSTDEQAPTSDRVSETGRASYYGRAFNGRRTASGERFNMKAMTAAHKTLPLGTIVAVENLDNHCSLIVKINDRGPFIKGRILDLSYGAAKTLGFARQGTTDVKITPLVFPNQWAQILSAETMSPQAELVLPQSSAPVPDNVLADKDSTYSIKVASFQKQDAAEDLKEDLSQFFDDTHIALASVSNQTFWRVMVGSYDSKREAHGDLARLKEFGHHGVVLKWKE